MHILLRVHDLDLFPQLGNDGARSPAVFKCEILHVKKRKKKKRKRNQAALSISQLTSTVAMSKTQWQKLLCTQMWYTVFTS